MRGTGGDGNPGQVIDVLHEEEWERGGEDWKRKAEKNEVKRRRRERSRGEGKT
jgi:hypothetical protein